MTEIRFYHLLRKTLEQALPELLEKCLQRGWHAVVMTGSEERTAALNHHLWTYSDRGFLPHGSAEDGDADRQPIWLTDRDENPNNAHVLFLTDGAETAQPEAFARVCEIFDGKVAAAVQAARGRWRRYRDAGHTLAYWQQSDTGRWEEKQRTEGGEGTREPPTSD